MKSEEKVLASRYAEGVYQYCVAEQKVAECLYWLENILRILSEYPEVKKILLNPNILLKEKMEFLHRLTEHQMPAYISIFIELLLRRRRFTLLPAITDIFRLLDEQARGYTRVEARVPFPLSEEDKRALIRALEKKLKSKIIWKEEVDKRIIGGIAVLVGNHILDDTLKTHLDQLKKNISLSLIEGGGK
ncbi:MAG: ATP synthase F1 subunit delta [bacterium JZ-2024 1]